MFAECGHLRDGHLLSRDRFPVLHPLHQSSTNAAPAVWLDSVRAKKIF
jgi:hypothetical protein